MIVDQIETTWSTRSCTFHFQVHNKIRRVYPGSESLLECGLQADRWDAVTK